MEKISEHIKGIIQKYCDLDGNGKIEKTNKFDEVSIFNKACESFNETNGDFFVCGKKYNAFNIITEEKNDAIKIKKPEIKADETNYVQKFRKRFGITKYKTKSYIVDKMYERWSKVYKDTNLDKKFYDKLYDIIDKLHCTIKDEDFKKEKYHSKKEQVMDEVIAIFARESSLNSRTINGCYNGIFQLDSMSLKTIQSTSDTYKIENINKKISIENFRNLSGEEQLDYLVGHIAYALKTGEFSKEKSMPPAELWAMIKLPNGWNNKKTIAKKNDSIQSLLRTLE